MCILNYVQGAALAQPTASLAPYTLPLLVKGHVHFVTAFQQGLERAAILALPVGCIGFLSCAVMAARRRAAYPPPPPGA